MDPVRHAETVMGTVVSFTVPVGDLPVSEIRDAIGAASRKLQDIDATLSIWKPESAMSRVRSGELGVEDAPAMLAEVLRCCEAPRELSGGWFDPWAMPGGVDPTGLVKGWAAEQAALELSGAGVEAFLINAAGDLVARGEAAPRRPWQVGIRDPRRPGRIACVVAVRGAIATSADYERPGQILDPALGRSVRPLLSATVTGPDLAQADALATGLAAEGAAGLERFGVIAGYEAYAIDPAGVTRLTAGFPVTRRPDSHAALSKR